jgi:acetate kinase
MNVLVINAGSTSLKYDVYDMDTEASLKRGSVERMTDVGAALKQVQNELAGITIHAVGHRVVHGGERLIEPTPIDAGALAIIEECAVFAPIHNPANLMGIHAAKQAYPDIPHVAVFDTAFHANMPEAAFVYALPYELYLEKGVRRYGFHGPSHQYMAASAAEFLKTSLSRLRLVTCHLGGGCSVAAIDGGISIDTSMGMTPLEGLVMGTRCGDLDPAIPLAMIRQGVNVLEVDDLLNKKSGLAGVSGIGADFRDVQAAAERGEVRARLAVDLFVRRIRKYIGAYAAELGGLDAIVFTGGIGENSAMVRERVCERLNFLGVDVDLAKNQVAKPSEQGGIVDVATKHAECRVLVVRTDEERMIARDVVRRLVGPTATIRSVHAKPIPVGVSVRHVHLSRADADVLFGKDYELSRKRDVTQPGQFVTRETVDLIGPKGEIRNVAIINPIRKATQVELARTDALKLGIDPPLRESGQLDNTPGVKLRGPAGEVDIPSGVILAMRHVHMNPAEAKTFGVGDKDVIRVRAEGDREMTMGDVLVRVSPSYALDMHIDTDEANAAGLTSDSVVAFEGVQRSATRHS